MLIIESPTQGSSSSNSGDTCVTSSKSCSNYRGDTWSCKFGQFCGTAQFSCFGVPTGCLGGSGSGSGSASSASVVGSSTSESLSSTTTFPEAATSSTSRAVSTSETTPSSSSGSSGSSNPNAGSSASHISILGRFGSSLIGTFVLMILAAGVF